MSTTRDIVRPLGLLERLYAARQVLGIYNSVIVTATVRFRTPHLIERKGLQSIFSAALSEVVNQHPPLRCQVHGLDTPAPAFKALECLDLQDVLQIDELNATTDLSEKLQELHDQTWSSDARPLWKLVVLRDYPDTETKPAISVLHLAFVYHHVLGDGLSGVAVLKSLIQELELTLQGQDDKRNDLAGTILPSDSVKLIEPVERFVKLTLSWSFLINRVMNEYAPRWMLGSRLEPWAGLAMQSPQQCPFRSRIKIVTIHADEVTNLLERCRKHFVALTSLLTAAVVSTLAIALPDASSFTGITPYTLRTFTGTSMGEMANQISTLETEYPPDLLHAIRTASTPALQTEIIWRTAHQSHRQMRDELARCPRDTVIGLLPYISDPVNFYRKKFGRPREATFEVSNLRVVSEAGTSDNWDLESMTFTQGAQPVAAAFSVNSVSVKDGPLRLTVTWQDGVVEERIIDAVVESLHGLTSIAS
ncbi:MAG: hypothetical protein Q9222_001186 [Ikaeria aurantiellina]